MLSAPLGGLGLLSFAAMKVAAPLVTGLNVIYLYVRDIDRSIDFYRGLLGIPIERHERDADWAEATFLSGVRFALHTARPESVKGSGSVNIGLEVEDIDAAAERLREAGIEVNEIEREFWGSVFTVTDPDGYAIDIFQRPAGTAAL